MTQPFLTVSSVPMPISNPVAELSTNVNTAFTVIQMHITDMQKKLEGTQTQKEMIEALAEQNQQLLARCSEVNELLRRVALRKERGSSPGRKGLATVKGLRRLRSHT